MHALLIMPNSFHGMNTAASEGSLQFLAETSKVVPLLLGATDIHLTVTAFQKCHSCLLLMRRHSWNAFVHSDFSVQAGVYICFSSNMIASEGSKESPLLCASPSLTSQAQSCLHPRTEGMIQTHA